MSVELHFNHQRRDVAPGVSLFDYADSLGIKVPTSCRKKGKCKECVVEVAEGMDCSFREAPAEKHLQGQFPVVLFLLQSSRTPASSAATRCGAARCGSNATRLQLPTERKAMEARSGGDARRRPDFAGRRGNRALDRADSRAGDGFGHHHRRAPAAEPGNRRSRRRCLV